MPGAQRPQESEIRLISGPEPSQLAQARQAARCTAGRSPAAPNSWAATVDGHVPLLPVTPKDRLLQAIEEGASDKYPLGVIVEKTTDGIEFRLLTEIIGTEYEEISAAIAAMARLEPPFHCVPVERNYCDLQAVYQFVTIILSLGREFATPDRNQLADSVATSIVNWLTAMRLFLDHEETELKRRFGKQPSEVEAFTAATAEAFDAEDPGYRFASKFRNYVQHCGVPLSRIDFVRLQGSNPRAKQSVRLLVDRDELLAKFDGWGPVKKDLQATRPSFELLPLIAIAMSGIRDVHKACARSTSTKHLNSPRCSWESLTGSRAPGHRAILLSFAGGVSVKPAGTCRRDSSPRMQFEFCSGSPEAIQVETVCGQRLTTPCRWRLTQRQFASSSIAITAAFRHARHRWQRAVGHLNSSRP